MCARNSIGVEVDKMFKKLHEDEIPSSDFIKAANSNIYKRVLDHLSEMEKITQKGNAPKYKNKEYGFSVMTRQEIDIIFERIESITWIEAENVYSVEHHPVVLSDARIKQKKRSATSKLRVPRGIYNR